MKRRPHARAALALTLLAAGCPSEPAREEAARPPPAPPPARGPSVPTATARPAPAPSARTTTAAPAPAPRPAAPRPPATGASAGATARLPSHAPGVTVYLPDHWYERYQAHMTEEIRRAYLETPPERRFERFGDLLLAYEEREARAAEARAKPPPPFRP